MRRVNDAELLDLIQKGVLQKDIATQFGVSPAYISKRKKQLEGFQEPESFSRLTDKQKKFVLAKAEGKTNVDAAMVAFDATSRESAKVLGCNTMKDPDVNTAIQDLLYQEGLGRRTRIKRLRDVIEAKDLGIAAKGLDMVNKLTGEYAPEQINISGQLAAIHALAADLRREKAIEGPEELTDSEKLDLEGEV